MARTEPACAGEHNMRITLPAMLFGSAHSTGAAWRDFFTGASSPDRWDASLDMMAQEKLDSVPGRIILDNANSAEEGAGLNWHVYWVRQQFELRPERWVIEWREV